MPQKTIKGFSKLSKEQKLHWVTENFFPDQQQANQEYERFWHKDGQLQKTLDGFSENTISNYVLPYGVAPNFLINGKSYVVPMVIEESSVVAAASSAAKFWQSRGGFHAEVVSMTKLGHIHFSWNGNIRKLKKVFVELEQEMRKEAALITANMEKRGGGVTAIELREFDEEPGYYQLLVSFETCDSMGANFINSVLESFAATLKKFITLSPVFNDDERELSIIMAILSNYTPDCLVRAWVACKVEDLAYSCEDMAPEVFAEKFYKAVRAAYIDPYRATTHNKGIMNGIDAVVIATANDFRAVEASCHAYAARSGQYRSLSECKVEDGVFKFWLELPLALGTIGGLTRIHPLAKSSLEMLGNPSAEELMMIVATTGLAQNFGAVRSLVTTGIQKGHMKMHLTNMLNHFNATPQEQDKAFRYFEKQVISFSSVRQFLDTLRSENGIAVGIKNI